jgi:beta-aspartyl-peptidase (threonine type)
MLASRVMQLLQEHDAQAASDAAIAELDRIGGEAGCIVIDREGRIGWSHNNSHFAIAYTSSDQPDSGYVWLSRQEEREARRRDG